MDDLEHDVWFSLMTVTGPAGWAELFTRPAWHARAACRGAGPGQWFPERGEDVRPAKAVCAGCSVRSQCAQDAQEVGRYAIGIWGGLSDRERRKLRRRRALEGEEAA